MRFLVYSSTNEATIRSNLGGVDYSYYFVLKSYLPLLEQLGSMEVLDQPLSAENERQWRLDEDTWYLSFTPPNMVELSSSAKILPVFAWEFGTLPDEKFITDSDDWNHVLSRVSGAITHSSFAVDVVRKSLGENYPVVSIPAPIWDSLGEARVFRKSGLLKMECLQLDCTVVDSADFSSVDGSLTSVDDQIISPRLRAGRDWDGSPIYIPFSDVNCRPPYWGFTLADSGELVFAGEHAWIVLPSYICEPVFLEISIISRRESAGALVAISLGGSSVVVRLEQGLLRHRLHLAPDGAANILGFSPCALEQNLSPHIVEIDEFSIVCAQPLPSQLEGGVVLDLARDESVYWYGAHHPEHWGRWTTESECGVTLPYSVSGNVRVRFNIVNARSPLNSVFKVHLGTTCQEVKLSRIPQLVELIFDGQPGTDHLAFSGLEVQELTSERLESQLGIGIADLKVDRADWDGSPLHIRLSDVANNPLCGGFNSVDNGGWRFTGDHAWMALPSYISEPIWLELFIVSRQETVGAQIRVSLGGSYSVLCLEEEGLLRHRLYLAPRGAANKLLFSLCSPGEVKNSEFLEIDEINIVRTKSPLAQELQGRVLDLATDASVCWYGVHEPEHWGRWTAESECGTTLPYSVSGNVQLSFNIVNALVMTGSVFRVHLGDRSQEVTLSQIPQSVELFFEGQTRTDQLAFSGLQAQKLVSEDSERYLGIGIADLQVSVSEFAQRQILDDSERDYLRYDEVLYHGFHPVEDWGRWTSAQTSQLLLPEDISGDVTFTICLEKNPHRFMSVIRVEIDGQSRQFRPRFWRKKYKLQFSGISRTNRISIHGCKARRVKKYDDARSLGLGFSSLTLACKQSTELEIEKPPIIYTAIFSPVDGRKNWPDILNAFIFALRDKPDAVLIVKIVHSEIQQFLDDLCNYFFELAPFKCRLIFVHGYLPDQQYKALIKATHFIANASRGEGQCLPLMEFMSSGVPAIAPDNTAMADYVGLDNSFIVKSSIEPAVWPQDPRLLFRTTRYRVNWESLYEAFITSYQVARESPEQYHSMSKQAVLSLQNYCSLETGRDNLLSFLGKVKSGHVR